MSDERETIADIVAEKRRRADEIERDVFAKMKSGEMVSDLYAREVIENLRREADRIEAAVKREAEGMREVMNIEELESVVDAMADEGGDQIDALYDTVTLNKDTYNGFICRLREVVRLAKNEQKKSAPVGNAAAMRKALEKVYRIASTAKNDFDVFAGIERIWRISEWVLASPPRNCDVGTEREQGVRFNAFCKKDCDRCSACPKATKYGIETPCYLIWAQMPYETEQKGETNGSK